MAGPTRIHELLAQLQLHEPGKFDPATTAACEELLKLVDRTRTPQMWAVINGTLADCLRADPVNPEASSERAIPLYEQAISALGEDSEPALWASNHGNVANLLLARRRGDRAENLRRAVDHCKAALRVFERQPGTLDWAATHASIAEALEELRVAPDEAIRHAEAALTVFTKSSRPSRWLSLTALLGGALCRQGPSEHQRAASYLVQAIEACPKDRHALYGSLNEMLGHCFSAGPDDGRAIHAFEAALDAYEAGGVANGVLRLHGQLGARYAQCTRGERAENRRRARSHLEAVLALSAPDDPALGYVSAGLARLRDDTAPRVEAAPAEARDPQDQEVAIAHYRAALASPVLDDAVRATMHANLAAAYAERTQGARPENVDLAIEHLERALEFERDAAQRARCHRNLSVLWRDRPQGERADNVERAIDQARRAGEGCSIESDPQAWAEAELCLGAALLAHPTLTRNRAIEGARHCRQAQRVFTRDADPQRWAACEQALEVVLRGDPLVQAIDAAAARLKRNTVEGDPFGKVADQMLAFLSEPDSVPKGDTRAEVTVETLEAFAAKIRDTVAERLGHASAGFLTVRVVEDTDVNAQVATAPPYDVVVSINLVRFCAEMSTLLTHGIGLNITGPDGLAAGPPAPPPASQDTIAAQMRTLMDSILRGEDVPPVPDLDAGPAHYMFAVMMFHGAMSFLTCHEFAHVVISDYRRRGETPPFEDFAESRLRPLFERLIAGRHPFDSQGLQGREGMDLDQVFRRWSEEITADIVGASLALEYQIRQGPWAAVPEIGAYARQAIHLSLVAQTVLGIYALWVRGDPMATPSHPPMDFRIFCVLQWMYGEQHAEAEGPIANYVGSILTRIRDSMKRSS